MASFGPFKGDAIISKRSLSGTRLKNATITGTQINLGTLGKVPSASHADTAGSANTASLATNATNATHASTADNATHATSADNAVSLGGASSGSYLRRTITEVAFASVLNGTFGHGDALCPSGYEAVGGGVEPNNVLTMAVTGSGPLLSDVSIGNGSIYSATPGQHAYAKGWRAFVVNNSGSTENFAVAAICAQIGP